MICALFLAGDSALDPSSELDSLRSVLAPRGFRNFASADLFTIPLSPYSLTPSVSVYSTFYIGCLLQVLSLIVSQLLVVASSKLSELFLWKSFHHSSVDSFSYCLFYFLFTFPYCQPADTGGVLEASRTLALPGAGIFIIIILQLGFFIIFFYSSRSVPYYLVYFSFIFSSDHSVSLASFFIVLQIMHSCSASDFFLALLER